jgi:pyruvate kinase
MNDIIRKVEETAESVYYRNNDHVLQHRDENFYSNNVVMNACRLARDTGARAVIGMTSSGYTAFRISSHRPKANIFVFTYDKSLLNTLSLLWGVRAFYYDKEKFNSTDETFQDIKKLLLQKGLLQEGDVFINTASMPISLNHRTNMLKLSIA